MAVDFTYDLTTDIGQVREFLWDRDVTSFLFTDTQIKYYIGLTNGGVYPLTSTITIFQVYLACAYALEAFATSLAELSTDEKIAIFQEDTSVTFNAVMVKVKRFYQLAAQEGGVMVSPVDNFYQLKDDTTNPFPTDATAYTPLSSLEVW